MREGPSTHVTYSCGGCQYETYERFQCQSDSGYDIHCNHPTIGRKHVASYGTKAPEWCPLLADAKSRLALSLVAE